ncbi:phosphotransferase family protein [Tsukamurella paurometabola]|uniref:Aminoglycoside phosphotransferase family protein n=1 Tax=Tsukamurella paurometabola TaxID=2061 RepID=A0ABS5N9T6_TSUPA|nr:aminoglycoside phosphotransferase family protein [Tsukamurella paurometabola]MBS4101023.1 aminoglycoside phosphotransferase family protein [Tsukamurella paurometabola]
MDSVDVVAAHRARATVRVGDVYLKIDGDPAQARREVRAMRLAPVPTPDVLWHRPPVLALTAVRGAALGTLDGPDAAPASAWIAAGAAIRTLHDAPLPPWQGRSAAELGRDLGIECAWLRAHSALPGRIIATARATAQSALRPWTPSFIHGDLQVEHVFVADGAVTGVIDWSEAGRGDPLYDIATLTLGHPDRLEDVLTGYGRDVDRGVVRGWWSMRCLLASRWLIQHGYDPSAPGCEFDVLRRLAD